MKRLDEIDLVAIGRTALANPDWPGRVERGSAIAPFNPAMLSPSASIKNSDRWLKSRMEAV
jgi:2,4-dienoyl-CoA reductase-like NADH-dependent reductase (Old Yellow Enzyme family)